MLARLKEMFVAGPSAAGSSRRSRVNLQRRFTILADASSQGSMSRVYKALDNETGRTVCLKVQIREKNAAAAARASREEARPPEGEIAIQVVHPHVVRTLEYGDTTSGEHYLVMEFIDGVSFQYLRESKLGRTAQKVEWLAQAAEGLAAVHAAGFIHHDINPRNFLVDSRPPGQADRLRPGRPQHAGLPRPGQPDRDAPVHGPRADPPRADRRADRHLRLRRPGLRVPHRPAPLRRDATRRR